MKAKKLIEVALPIKEISAESVRDKSIRHGHISTLHLWWARRPLPVCRAIVFASLVPDPLDENCPKAFKDAVQNLLNPEHDNIARYMYKPYNDIPYTAVLDPMEDNGRNRLMMFIGKFSDTCQKDMLAGKTTSPKDQLSEGSLIKWENKNNPRVLRIARELIWVAYNAENHPEYGFETHHRNFEEAFGAITKAESLLYNTIDRHISSAEIDDLENDLQAAIDNFQSQMPSVFDPFAGGGAIPLEAARLGCRSYGNDINPVAHIIEKGSAEFPQKYGKPISYSSDEFLRIYGKEGIKLYIEQGRTQNHSGYYELPNRLAFDVEYYANKILSATEAEVGYLYPKDEKGNKPVAYYWARTVKCSNPSCGAEVPMLKQFYLCNTSKKKVHLSPIIEGNNIEFEIKKGISNHTGFLKSRECSLTCPCCGSVTSAAEVKKQAFNQNINVKLLAVIKEGANEKVYELPSEEDKRVCSLSFEEPRPEEKLPDNDSQNLKIPHWGFKTWGSMFSNRQIHVLNTLVKNLQKTFNELPNDDYGKCIATYLGILIDKQGNRI